MKAKAVFLNIGKTYKFIRKKFSVFSVDPNTSLTVDVNTKAPAYNGSSNSISKFQVPEREAVVGQGASPQKKYKG